MRVRKPLVAAASLLAVALLVRCLPTVGEQSDWDVRGNYDLTYDDRLTLKLDLAGAVREATATGYGNVVDFGAYNGQPLTLDLGAFCARPEVVCPSESLWRKVAIDVEDVSKAHNVHVIQVVNNETRELPDGGAAQTLGGLVAHDQQDRFVVGLGASGGASGSCGALGISLAGGRFTHAGEELVRRTEFRTPSGEACDPDAGLAPAEPDAGDAGASETCRAVELTRLEYPKGAAVDGIAEGRVFVGWLGACAFGPVVAAATLTIETGFTGKRTGDFDPPPFARREPVDVAPNDAGLAGPPDAGAPPPPPADAATPEPPDAG